MDETFLTSGENFRDSSHKFDRAQHIWQASPRRGCDNPSLADQKQNAMRKQYWDGCLAHVGNIFLFTKVQPVVQYCKLTSYCEAKATNLKTANRGNM